MSLFAFVGSQNRTDTTVDGTRGIHVFRRESGWQAVAVEAAIDNPSYLTLTPDAATLYAVSEVVPHLECTVSAYRADRASGALTYLNRQPTRGRTACHVAVLPGGRLGVANYSYGDGGPDQAVCFCPLLEDGRIDAPDSSARHRASAGRALRDRSHAHCVVVIPGSEVILVADLGLDCIIGYDMGCEEIVRLDLPAGHGPRHIVCHPDGRHLYVLNELNPCVSMLEWNGTSLLHLGDVATLELDEHGPVMAGAAIQLSADSRFLYTSTRGVDLISVFAVSADGATLERVETIGCGGKWPRDFTLTPDDRQVLVANQQSDTIAIFYRDGEIGRLTDTGERIAVMAPQCVKLVELG